MSQKDKPKEFWITEDDSECLFSDGRTAALAEALRSSVVYMNKSGQDCTYYEHILEQHKQKVGQSE